MKKCVGCGELAISWTGHIHTEIGTIAAGWCTDNGVCTKYVKPQTVRYCQSTNPSSCYGEYKLDKIELIEELTKEVLMQHAKSQEFSRRVNVSIYGKV